MGLQMVFYLLHFLPGFWYSTTPLIEITLQVVQV
jgi:hypothetical protein